MSIISKQFSDEFNKFYLKIMKDNGIDNDDYYKLVKVFEDYKKIRKQRRIFLSQS